MDTLSSNFRQFYKEFKDLMAKYNIPYYIFKTPTMTMTCGMNDEKGVANDSES